MINEVEDAETKAAPSKLFFSIVISIVLTVSCFTSVKYLRGVEEKKQATAVKPLLGAQEELASRGYIDRAIKLPLVSTKTSLIEEKAAMARKSASTKEKSVPQVVKEEPAPEPVPENTQTFTATAYDLSVQSCGKPIGHPQYGITSSGANIAGKTREQAMSIAVDPNVIPLGSQVKITFPEPYTHFNGVYTANDTGDGIKGKKIDIFMGDFGSNNPHQSVWDFGVREVEVQVLK
jgi:3D (Asp-Asp-Asp) domain-containing protein